MNRRRFQKQDGVRELTTLKKSKLYRLTMPHSHSLQPLVEKEELTLLSVWLRLSSRT